MANTYDHRPACVSIDRTALELLKRRARDIRELTGREVTLNDLTTRAVKEFLQRTEVEMPRENPPSKTGRPSHIFL